MEGTRRKFDWDMRGTDVLSFCFLPLSQFLSCNDAPIMLTCFRRSNSFMKTPILKKTGKGGFTLIELMVVIAILATLASIGYGPILDHMNDGDRQKANTNLKSVFTLLQQFKMDNGTYPCDATGETLQESNADRDFGDLKGDHSNAYFRQLFFKSGVESEKPFFAKLSAPGLNIQKEG